MSRRKWWQFGDNDDNTLTGSARGDWLFGRGGNDTIHGNGGNDRIWGGHGNDTLSGDDGNDRVYGGCGDDTIDGGAGNDYLKGGSGVDMIRGGAGNDRIKGGCGDDRLSGDDGNDRIHGGSGDDHIDGGNGCDRIDGGSGDDNIRGGAGKDRLFGGWGNDTIDGGDGNDRLHGGRGDDDMRGGDGDDKLKGERGNDTMDGGDGDDRLYGGCGDDHIDGGAGNDNVKGGSGNDCGYYLASENDGARDFYDGGRGHDHIRIDLTGSGIAVADLQEAMDAYGALLEAGQFHRSFEFEALGLTVRNWESFEIVTDDPVGGPEVGGPEVGGPVAANDSVIEGAAVIQEQEANNYDPAQFNVNAQGISRSDFRITPNENVGDASLPSVSILAELASLQDDDLFAFELEDFETITFDIDFTTPLNPPGLSLPDTTIYLLDANGNFIDWNTDSALERGGAGSDSFSDSFLEFDVPLNGAGTYYLNVRGAGGEGPYTLNVSIAPADGNATKLGGFEILADTLLANDQGAVAIVSVDNALNGRAETTAAGDVFFTPDSEYAAAFDYIAEYADGSQSAATVTVNALNNGIYVKGTSEGENLAGTSGNDLFNAGAGNDELTGDEGLDLFVFSAGSGEDRIIDFMLGIDALAVTGGITANSLNELGGDTVVGFDSGDFVTLVGVTGVADLDQLFV